MDTVEGWHHYTRRGSRQPESDTMTVPSESAASSTPDTPAPAPQVVVIGAGPAGLTAAYELASTASAAPSSRPTTSSAASAAPSSATAGASTSAATASSPRSSEVEALWHEILADEDFLQRPAHEPHLLPAASSSTTRCKAVERARATSGSSRRSAACCSYLWVRDPPAEGPDDASRAGSPPASAGASTALLQDLHREGVGRARRPRSRPTGRAQRIKDLSLCNAVWEPIRARCRQARTRPSRSPASSRSSSTRSTAPG